MGEDSKNYCIKEELRIIYNAIIKDGGDPKTQLSGYILSEDPIYIPDIDGARGRICRLDRDDILDELISDYFK